MYESILRLPAVMKRTGLCRSSIYQGIKDNQFPKPVKLGKRAIGWPESEINGWIEERVSQAKAA